ncbi:Glucosamine kinase GspK [compost metagenome]
MYPGQETGILIVAGTGSSAIGMAHGQLYTCGGWGHKLGDEGSGYAIALGALQSVCRAYDRRAEPTALTELVLEALGLTEANELIAYMHEDPPSKQEIASLAKLVVTAADRSDAQAIAILQQAADDLLGLIRGLSQQTSAFGEWTPVTGAGSIFHRIEAVRTRIASGLLRERLGVMQAPYGSPLDGAITMALETIRS